MKRLESNICMAVGAVIRSTIQEIKLEDTANRESLGRLSASDLFDGLYNAALSSSNPNSFLRSVRYYAQLDKKDDNGIRTLTLEFYR